MSKPVCPTCDKELGDKSSVPTFPFCSARCRLVDLGNWLGDRYVIAHPAPDESELREDELAALLQDRDLQ